MNNGQIHNKEDIVSEYRRRFPEYQAFAARLHALLETLLKGGGLHLDHVESRVKTLESFLQKIEQKRYHHAPFEKIKDLVGLRVVVYYQDEVQRVRTLIEREFTVDEDHSVDKTTNQEADRFGYRSLHLIISLGENRSTLDEWKPLGGLCAEVQVRSILQHTWAVFSRELDYKVPSQAPDQLRRQLFRLSAQLEAADEEFTVLRNRSRDIANEYRKDVEQGQLALPLDLDSLREFVEQHIQPEEWERLGVRAGMTPFPLLTNTFQSAGLKMLLRTLQAAEVKSIAEFEGLFPEFQRVEPFLQRFVEVVKAQGGTIHAVPVDVLVLLVSFVRADRIQEDFDWGGKFDHVFLAALRQVVHEMLREVSS